MQEEWFVVIGVFAYGVDAGEAIHALESRGFDESSTSLLMPEDLEELFRIENRVPGARSSVYGSLLTTLVNGLVSVGSLVEDGCDVVMAGPALSALPAGGSGCGASEVRTALAAHGLADEEVRALPRDLEEGKVLVIVRCASRGRERTAERALRIAGAERTSRT